MRQILLLASLGGAVNISHGADPATIVRDGVAGFVVSHIQYALAPDASETGACPTGMNESYQNRTQAYFNLPSIEEIEGETPDEQFRRVREILSNDPDVKSYCEFPQAGAGKQVFKTLTGNDFPVGGINLDGEVSVEDGSASSACPHQDFTDSDGVHGIDNQYARVVGCSSGYQSSGQANLFNIGQLTGAWGIVIRLTDVDSLVNDDHVGVGIFANGDPIRLSPQRDPLEFGTYTVHSEPRFHAISQGKIVDGVLTSEPVEVRIPYDTNAMFQDRVLRDAQLQVVIGPDGHLDGYLGGYAPVEEQYDLEYGFRDARVGTSESSELSPYQRRLGSAIGKASALGYTCEGIYSALYENADGHYDPESGACTSVSIQYKIEAIPAFVLDQEDEIK